MDAVSDTLAAVARDWRPAPIDEATTFDPAIGAAVAGVWDAPEPRAVVPPLWHWFHFVEWVGHRRVGADGHVVDGHFLPPLPDRRRMFAGGTATTHSPLRYGEPVQRTQTLHDVVHKTGRTGALLFVTVRSELHQDGRLCVVEDQDIVYRSGPSSVDLRGIPLATGPAPVPDGAAHLPLRTDAPLLFRMSALTGNQHRIHYDQPYTVGVEHYPGLVVHGPLLVLHMLELVRRGIVDGTTARVGYRLHAPVFLGEPLAAVADDDGTLRVATAREQRHASVRLG